MKIYATALAILTVLSGSTAFAQTSAQGSAGAGLSGIVDSEISTQVKNVVETLIGVDATTSVSGGATVNATNGTNTNASADTNADATAGISVITISRADVEGGNTETSVIAASSVRTQADLSGYVAAQIVADENISEVEASAQDVSVTYAQRAKLFGFVPVHVEATATVMADGSVDVSYPWYAFLMTTNEAELEASLHESVEGSAALAATADASVGFDSQAQAELVNEIRTTMEAELEAALAAEAAAGATVE